MIWRWRESNTLRQKQSAVTNAATIIIHHVCGLAIIRRSIEYTEKQFVFIVAGAVNTN